MKRFSTANASSASAPRAEASFSCANVHSVVADVLGMSAIIILRVLINLLGLVIPQEPLVKPISA